MSEIELTLSLAQEFQRDLAEIKEHHALPKSAFVSGYCAEFAVGLAMSFGYQVGAFLEHHPDEDGEPGDTFTDLAHAFAYHPSAPGMLIDAEGVRSIDQAHAQLLHGPGEPGEFREHRLSIRDLDALAPIQIPALDSALHYIRENQSVYAVAPDALLPAPLPGPASQTLPEPRPGKTLAD